MLLSSLKSQTNSCNTGKAIEEKVGAPGSTTHARGSEILVSMSQGLIS